ncbi:MAG TPA: 4Fe-4S binding protein [Thermoanaerobaculales bacterium]|nr:4Fe-4S binding protein [Thermoanaerobaculales bacterium]HQL30824.1 4Fe-4S binding protein [Thermoanaerobaculales bacterium]HQN96313.1 4Fe-4S binding protein [Thermoanaerobaculales bacterium]HQP43275.1 4Fe-4S binding protein [Thermoanaerobaculales bacterium]
MAVVSRAARGTPAADVYVRLARALDGLPHGYPATDSGVELAILRKIFRPEDAAMALRLKPLPETAAMVARRLHRPTEEVRGALDGMAARGQIFSFRQRGRRYYCLAPFIVGIWEFQLNHIDRELAELFEAYAPTLLGSLGRVAPALARVIPVNRRIEARAEILAYDDLKALLSSCSSFRVADCLCRTEQALLGRPCSHTLETCMSFSKEPNAYEGSPPWGREITKQEALELLDRLEEEGLVHCTYNFQREPFFVCNCCSCCCGFLRAVNEHAAPYMLARSNYASVIDLEACTDCGDCEGGRCPVSAISSDGGGHVVDQGRCIGCGVCALACPYDAIRLVPRPESDRLTPPGTLIDWSLDRVDHRHGRLKGAAMRGWLVWEGLKMAARRGAHPEDAAH